MRSWHHERADVLVTDNGLVRLLDGEHVNPAKLSRRTPCNVPRDVSQSGSSWVGAARERCGDRRESLSSAYAARCRDPRQDGEGFIEEGKRRARSSRDYSWVVCGANIYPTPRTVLIMVGCFGSTSIFRRKWVMRLSMERSRGDHSRPSVMSSN